MSQKGIEFHYAKVSKLFNDIIQKKTISRKKQEVKLSICFLKFLSTNFETIISGQPHELLIVNEEYNKLGLIDTDKNNVESFFKQTGYENFQKNHSKEFLNYLEIDTCTYCNRNYTLNLTKTHTRAELDHWFPKDKFPILALSFYNLIPSCHSCNHIKGNGDDLVKEILNITTSKKQTKEEKKEIHNKIYDWWKEKSLKSLNHPYSSNDKKFKFSYFYESLDSFKVITKTKDKIIEETLKFNKTEDIYNAHSDKELKDLLDLRYKYSKNYLEILLEKTFTELSMSKEEAYRMIFGIEIKEEDYHKRPFSKFKHDIIEELLRISTIPK